MSEFAPKNPSAGRDPWKALHYIGVLTTGCIVDHNDAPEHVLEVINSILREYLADDPAEHPNIESVLRTFRQQREERIEGEAGQGEAAGVENRRKGK